MAIQFAIGGVFILLVLLWSKMGDKAPAIPIKRIQLPKQEPTPTPVLPPKHEPPVSLPQQFRRWQQHLIRRENRVLDREAYQTFKEREISLTEKGISLSQQEVELVDLANQITNERKQVELEHKEILIEIEGQKVELKDLISFIQHRENLLVLQEKEIQLNGQKVELQDLFNNILHEGKKVDLSKRELKLEKTALEQEYNKYAFEMQKATQALRYLIMDFNLEKKSWDLQVREQKLSLYHSELSLLEAKISDMYQIKMEWLRIQEKDNTLLNREQRLQINQEQLRLQNIHDATVSKLRQLDIKRDEIELLWDRKALEDRWRRLKEIESSWRVQLRLPSSI